MASINVTGRSSAPTALQVDKKAKPTMRMGVDFDTISVRISIEGGDFAGARPIVDVCCFHFSAKVVIAPNRSTAVATIQFLVSFIAVPPLFF
jgi:hypothetical protein